MAGDMCSHRGMAEATDMGPSGDNTEEQSTDDIREKIKNIFGKYDVGSRYAHIPLPRASILLPVLIRRGKLHLLLTVRSLKLNTMPGDVCFPGGRQDPSDEDDIQTALRETQEEIGLCPEQVQVIGRLPPNIARSPNCLVTPVVGIVDDTFQPTPNPSEVADIFVVPLEFFISSEHYTAREVNVPHFGLLAVHQFIYMDPDTEKTFTIWGLTAHVALMLSIILLEKRPSFDPEFDLEGGLNGWKRFLTNPSKL